MMAATGNLAVLLEGSSPKTHAAAAGERAYDRVLS
jgi:hypothetical protein